MSDVPDRVDCLQFPSDDADEVRLVPAGLGERVVAAHREAAQRRQRRARLAGGAAVVLTGLTGLALRGPSLVTAGALLAVAVVVAVTLRRGAFDPADAAPVLVDADVAASDARERYEVAVASRPFADEAGPEAAPGDGDG
jgi:hypothetical protein